MTKRKLKPFVVPMLYGIGIIAIIFGAYFMQSLISSTLFADEKTIDDPTNYVDGEIIEPNNQLPVISTEAIIIRPYTSEGIKIAKNFYDYQDEASDQQNAIIYYENTYIQNSGVDYQASEVFDVVSILDGTVEEVKEDQILGKVVQIRHSNDMISVYQSLSEVSVQEGDEVLSGQIIGKSGTSNINADLGNHLHFELYYQGQIVNPEDYYDKNLKDL